MPGTYYDSYELPTNLNIILLNALCRNITDNPQQNFSFQSCQKLTKSPKDKVTKGSSFNSDSQNSSNINLIRSMI